MALKGPRTRDLPTAMQHSLRALLAPASVALVGASERPGAIGRVVFENIRAGGFTGALHAVNPNHRRIFGARSFATIARIGEPVDLAVIATPAASVRAVLDDAAAAGAKAAVVITAAPGGDPQQAREWADSVVAHAKSLRIRLVGPGAFGVIRTDIGLNATFSDVAAGKGRLALVSQSGAVCTAMLDFAAPMGIGFSSVISLNEDGDVDVGELLDALLTDTATDGILMYVEAIADARRFMSALRAAARVKPVVVLKAGRSLEIRGDEGAPTPDEVFDVALHRAGTLRVQTYTQLFAAARALAMARIPRGDRLAIVANGRGAALLAADRAFDLGMPLAALSKATRERLDTLLPGESARSNPVDVRGYATAADYAATLAATLADDNVDAVVALYVPRPIDSPQDMARAAAQVAQASGKPVLAAWLGAVDRNAAHAALEAGGVANFYTPENAVEGFAFLAAYRRNQQWLLEAPSSMTDGDTPDLGAAGGLLSRQRTAGPARLAPADTVALLDAFRIAHVDASPAASAADARAAARRLRYPVLLVRDGDDPRRTLAANTRALEQSFAQLSVDGEPLRVVATPRIDGARVFAVGVHVDATFGPVITLGAASYFTRGASATMLPPLNRRLALDLVAGCGEATAGLADPSREALARLLLQVSALACALPSLQAMVLEPVMVGGGEAMVVDARIDVDTTRALLPHYAHMAIHPYPVELEGDVRLRDGQRLFVRPIRPEDADLERRFVAGLSDQTRYFRFFYQLHELTPQMLARFTQVDYDRELALVAFVGDARGCARDGRGRAGGEFVAIARYVLNADRSAAEFAVVVADAWQRRGVGYALMQRLMDAARNNGVARFEGTVLRGNPTMLRFSAALGFTMSDDPADAEQVIVSLPLS